MPTTPDSLPYKIACLCDLRDKDGRVLLLRRLKAPNFGLCSPIGGKLDMHTGESPAQCAQREIAEEAGIHVEIADLHLAAIISEAGYENKTHWLMFYYRVMKPVWVEPKSMREGELAWFKESEIDGLPLPDTDRRIIWPLIKEHEARPDAAGRPSFFAVHIDCTGPELKWTVEQHGRVLPH